MAEPGSSELWDWMEAQAANAPERGLQALLVDMVGQLETLAAFRGVQCGLICVAEKAGLPPDWCSTFLNDPSNAKVGDLVRIANVLGAEWKTRCWYKDAGQPAPPAPEPGTKEAH
jgi:hypothetical protein